MVVAECKFKGSDPFLNKVYIIQIHVSLEGFIQKFPPLAYHANEHLFVRKNQD